MSFISQLPQLNNREAVECVRGLVVYSLSSIGGFLSRPLRGYSTRKNETAGSTAGYSTVDASSTGGRVSGTLRDIVLSCKPGFKTRRGMYSND